MQWANGNVSATFCHKVMFLGQKNVLFGVMDKFHAFFETLRSNGQISCSPLYFLLK